MTFTTSDSQSRTPVGRNPLLLTCIVLFVIIWALTLIFNSDLNNWFIENTLTVLSLLFLILTYRKYHFSDLSYLFIFLFLCMHVFGSQHTYAENPLGYWLQDLLHWERNHYDRMVHFAFGFLLAYPLREMYIRWLKYPRTLAWLMPLEFALAVGGLYELIEYAVAEVFFPEQGPAYLGTQGDVWDAQKDIGVSVLGAAIASTVISLLIRRSRNSPTEKARQE